MILKYFQHCSRWIRTIWVMFVAHFIWVHCAFAMIICCFNFLWCIISSHSIPANRMPFVLDFNWKKKKKTFKFFNFAYSKSVWIMIASSFSFSAPATTWQIKSWAQPNGSLLFMMRLQSITNFSTLKIAKEKHCLAYILRKYIIASQTQQIGYQVLFDIDATTTIFFIMHAVD